MTNKEMYKTVDERKSAFLKYCCSQVCHDIDAKCNRSKCLSEWLEFETDDETLLPCPFCGKLPVIVVEDDEGNVHGETEYEENPWSGLWYALKHVGGDCLIADDQEQLEYSRDIGGEAFKTRDEAVKFWNDSIRRMKR